MTREEIEKLAKQIVNDVEGVNSYERSYGYVTEDLVALVRATLQEAARAVCKRCAQEFPERDDQSADYWHPPSSYGSILCDASGIHDLIAALEGGKP